MRNLLVAFLLLTGASLHAAPTISTVTGDYEHGSQVVISGTGYGTKSPAAPLRWAPFDTNGNPSSLGQGQTWNQNQNMNWDADEGYNGGPGMKGTGGAGTWTLRVDSSSPYWNASGQKTYIARRERKNFIPVDHPELDGDDHNFKSWRVWPAGISGMNGTIGEHNGRPYIENTGCSGDSGYWANTRTNTTNWVFKELFMKAGSGACVKDGTLRERFNGVDKHSGTIITQRTSAQNWQSHYVVHGVAANTGSKWSDPAWSTSLNFWADDVYVDTTWQRVMIGDASTFANCRKFGFVIPSAWSATQITGILQFHASDFPDGSTAYVYVFDTDNATNATGKAITISGSVAGNPAPTVNNVVLSTGNYEGTSVSTMNGTGFLSGFTMTVGTMPVTSATLLSSTQIRFTIPAGLPGSSGHDLRFDNSDGQFAVLRSSISYTNAVVNLAPYDVSAGDNWEITLPATTLLSGAASDDGLPSGTLTYLWEQQSGPGTITFADATALQTSAVFSQSGTYTITLTASDGTLSTQSDTVTVTVHPVVTPPSGGSGSAFGFYKQ